MKKNFINKISVAIAMFTIVSTPAFSQTVCNLPKDVYFSNYPSNQNFSSEMIIIPGGAKFTLWSPNAQEVKVNIYASADASTPLHSFPLTYDSNTGSWNELLIPSSLSKKNLLYKRENLFGLFYTFSVKVHGKWLAENPGIWAKAVSVNGNKGAIIDFAKTNPAGWESDKGPVVKNQTDAIIYEMHHRDFSVHPNSGIKNKGKFVALLENGTLSLNGEKTGINHLKELGITHVHILPSYDYNSVDETKLTDNKYNWGYDPYNYNAPEGSYSTNPYDPATRVKEMKEMVKALHDAGIGVIMDVVYNHTALNDDSNFSLTAPGYFYRHRQDGSYSDASGCGNETASERSMVRSYIINSVKYWMQEYHIDGFRFDLMGIHDIETMNQLATELKAINPSVLLYGEGWTAGDSPLPVEKRALKDHAYQMPQVAVFSDDIRDGVKGHYSAATDKGFATGKHGLEETIKFGIVGATQHPQIDYSKCNNSKAPYAISPNQVVNYVSCHDDLTLTDKLAASMPNTSVEERQRAAKLAQTIVFTSQGIPFMFTGEEIFRNKKGVHNSYQSPDSINAIDWNMKKENRELFDYYKNLISLRKSHPAFRMTSPEQIAKHLVFDDTNNTPLLVSYSLKDNANGDNWNEIKVIFNGSDESKTIDIPEAEWVIIANDGNLNPDGLGHSNGGNITIAPRSAFILAK